MKGRAMGALAYPIFLGCVGSAVVLVLYHLLRTEVRAPVCDTARKRTIAVGDRRTVGI